MDIASYGPKTTDKKTWEPKTGVFLFDLEHNVGENWEQNLVDEKPEIVNQLHGLLRQAHSSILQDSELIWLDNEAPLYKDTEWSRVSEYGIPASCEAALVASADTFKSIPLPWDAARCEDEYEEKHAEIEATVGGIIQPNWRQRSNRKIRAGAAPSRSADPTRPACSAGSSSTPNSRARRRRTKEKRKSTELRGRSSETAKAHRG
eukprot:TRINITY_DN5130_c0_g1_i1.p1 TRINITY_DN5130_c0_g1~~TRINITY_DN5130_c0_g1_i1.p1  ORF type:complete len:205 (-),score=37.30 TRINITY_DN5130_c0_g1_i1:2-616(-)